MDRRGVCGHCRTLGGFKKLIIVFVTPALRVPIFVLRAAVQIEFRGGSPKWLQLSSRGPT